MGESVPKTRFQAWRLANGLTIGETSALIGLSQSYVSRVEKGERVLPPLTKVKVARRLGARLSDLFEVEEISA